MPANGQWPYADPRWEPTRRYILARDGYACTICHIPARLLDIDHIIEWRLRPDLAFDPTNLTTLCRRHHNQKTHSRNRRPTSRTW